MYQYIFKYRLQVKWKLKTMVFFIKINLSVFSVTFLSSSQLIPEFLIHALECTINLGSYNHISREILDDLSLNFKCKFWYYRSLTVTN